MHRRADKLILIVDDFVDFLPRIRAELRDHGYRVMIAEDGQKGLEKFISTGADLVITNIHMPRMNGLQLLKALRHLSPSLPVVLDTGFAHYSRFFPDKVARADAFFEKPIQMTSLLNCVDDLLGFPSTYDEESEKPS